MMLYILFVFYPFYQFNIDIYIFLCRDHDGSLDGSCIGDYMDQPSGLLGAVKRRGSASGGSGEDSGGEGSPRGSKIRRCSRPEGLNVHYVDVCCELKKNWLFFLNLDALFWFSYIEFKFYHLCINKSTYMCNKYPFQCYFFFTKK